MIIKCDKNSQMSHKLLWFDICQFSILSVIQTTTAVPTTVQTNNGYSHQSGGQQTRTTQDPDIDVNHELPVFVG